MSILFQFHFDAKYCLKARILEKAIMLSFEIRTICIFLKVSTCWQNREEDNSTGSIHTLFKKKKKETFFGMK